MKRASLLWRGGVLLALFAVLVTLLHAAERGVDPAMVGSWEGKASIVVNWCAQKELPVRVTIAADGTVTGTVGDATLLDGRLRPNRGWLGRKLKLASDHLIVGDLQGPLIAAEGITRSGVVLPLNFKDGAFQGGLHSTGAKFGGKEKMVLSATKLRLTPVPPPAVVPPP